ncbi:MAG: ATP-binding protein [Bacteroidales bacterium]|jgi:hypothetical protein|nr:ATP-binding protein [Bacteroidales bacterium]
MEMKLLKIGDSIFDSQIRGGYYYVDKSLLIKDLFDHPATVTLITRPRRFGKTLNMYMLKSFFEYNCELRMGNENRQHLFDGLKIAQTGERYMQHFGQYPVIFLSFKEAKAGTWEVSYQALKDCIYYEFQRHGNIADSEKLSGADRGIFHRFLDRAALDSDFPRSIRFLSDCLYAHYGKRVVILIDEYDVPLESSFTGGFYRQMLELVRSMFSSSLKDSNSLAFAVMTGCLRISKESIFTGLNNPKMVSILSAEYSEHFGFTQQEVDDMLQYYGLESKREETKDWYDGYLFGKTEVYNPWSIINYVSNLITDSSTPPKAHWINSSGNDIVRLLINEVVDSNAQSELETLVKGGSISKEINENITYFDAFSTVDNLWNMLLFTGYLKRTGDETDEEGITRTILTIPNQEVMTIYRQQIRQWFKSTLTQNKYPQQILAALIAGDVATAEALLSDLLYKSISYYDSAENFYHGFLTALLTGTNEYEVKSNRETGGGRSDVLLRPKRGDRMPVIIVEIKIATERKDKEAKSEEALRQIEAGHYADGFIAEGYPKILKYGIAFFKKECVIKN